MSLSIKLHSVHYLSSGHIAADGTPEPAAKVVFRIWGHGSHPIDLEFPTSAADGLSVASSVAQSDLQRFARDLLSLATGKILGVG